MQKTVIILAAVLLTACSAKKYASTAGAGDDNYLPVYIAEQIKAGNLSRHPVVVIDGQAVRFDINSTENVRISKEEIYSIECIKKNDKSAMARYGRNIRVGLVIIVTKGDEELADKPKEEQTILFFLDERELTKEQVAKVNPDDVESITIIKGKEDVSKYTDKDYDGVIIIKLKEGKAIPQ